MGGAIRKSLAGPEGEPGDELEKEKEEVKEELGGAPTVDAGTGGSGGSISKNKGKRKKRRRRNSGSEGVLVPEESPPAPPKKRKKNPGRFVRHKKIYDSVLGETCHWCRQKTVARHVRCSRLRCTVKYCWRCLMNRNGEAAEAEMAPQVLWVCPKCRGGCGPGCKNCCNCGPCRKAQGLEPTGHLIKEAKGHGFTNAHDYLVHQVTGEGQDVLAARKRGRCWTSDGGAGSLGQEQEPGPGPAGSCSFENVKVEMEMAGTADNVSLGVAEGVPVAAGTAGWSFNTLKVEVAEDVPVAAATADWTFGTVELARAEDVLTVAETCRALGEPRSDGHVGADSSTARAPPGGQILKSVKSETVDDVSDGAGTYRACEDPTPSVSAVEDSGATDGPAPAGSWSCGDLEEVLLGVAGTQQGRKDPRPSCGLVARELDVAKLELGEDVPAPVTGPVADFLSSKKARHEIAFSVQDGMVQKTSSSNGGGMHADIGFSFGFEPVRMEEDTTAVEEIASQQVAEADVVGDTSLISGLCMADPTSCSEGGGVLEEEEDSEEHCGCGYFDPPRIEESVICLSDSESEKKDGNKVDSLSSSAMTRQLRRITRSRGSLDQWKPTPSKKRFREGLAELSVPEPSEENRWPFGEKGNGFQEKLDAFLNGPFSEQELVDRMDLAERRTPKEKVRQMRRRVVVCRTTEKGFSYLDHYPGLAEKISSAVDKEKLTLLRGFFFWLQHSMLPGAYQPWNKGQDKGGKADDCLEVDPDCELIAVCVPVDSKPAGAKKRASSLPKADASCGPASGKVGTANLVRRSLNFSSKKTSNSKCGR